MNGVINVLKPPQMTSFDVVHYIRKITKEKKVGHTGTLDPMAVGVLPVCIGKATKIVDYLMNGEKTYICEMKLGNVSDTFDRYGKFALPQDKEVSIDYHKLKEVIDDFTGVIYQKPPAYSAIKINGERAYNLARKGIEVDLKERKIEIYNTTIKKIDSQSVLMEVKCSKGTYIRSLCHDIGQKLGCGAYMNFLLRTKTGNFHINNSYTLEELSNMDISSALIKIDDAIDLNSIYVDRRYTKSILNGNSIPIDYDAKNENEEFKIYINENTFAGIGYVKQGNLYVKKLLI